MEDVTRSPSRSPSIAKRGLAVVVLAIAAFIIFKLVWSFIAAIFGTLVIIAAIVAIIWAIRTL
jgi:hypothetical protein